MKGHGDGQRYYGSAGRRLAVVILLATVLVTVAVGAAWPLPNQARENEIKAVLLERFTHFISWPVTAADTARWFTICVYGESSLTEVLREVYEDRRILGREVRILDCQDSQVLPSCDLLYVARSHAQDLPRLCTAASTLGALTVADTPGFGQRGVMINFFRDEDRVRFEINESAVQAAGFSMSYHLLKEARILQPSGDVP